MVENSYVREINFINDAILMRTQKYKHVTCHQLEPNGFLFAEYANNLKVNLDMAKMMVANRLEFTDNKPHYVIIDISNIKEVTAEAKEYMQHPEGGLKNILGAAFIANNPVAEMLANIYVKTPVDFEVRFFREKEEAVSWIKGYINRRNQLPIAD
jgi:hypothetical protein